MYIYNKLYTLQHIYDIYIYRDYIYIYILYISYKELAQ